MSPTCLCVWEDVLLLTANLYSIVCVFVYTGTSLAIDPLMDTYVGIFFTPP